MHAAPAMTGVQPKMRNFPEPTLAQASYRPAEEASELQEPSHPTKPEPLVGETPEPEDATRTRPKEAALSEAGDPVSDGGQNREPSSDESGSLSLKSTADIHLRIPRRVSIQIETHRLGGRRLQRSWILLCRDPHGLKFGRNEILVSKTRQTKIDWGQRGPPPTKAQRGTGDETVTDDIVVLETSLYMGTAPSETYNVERHPPVPKAEHRAEDQDPPATKTTAPNPVCGLNGHRRTLVL